MVKAILNEMERFRSDQREEIMIWRALREPRQANVGLGAAVPAPDAKHTNEKCMRDQEEETQPSC